MFTITKNSVYTINKAAQGRKKDGSSYALIKFIESQNQPEGIERPSKSNSAVNVWFESFPKGLEGITDGANVRLLDFDGVKWIHEEYCRQNGDKAYRDVLELVNAKFEKA